MKFIYPPTLSTGDVLSKYHLDCFRLNDEYFNGAADAWRPVWPGAYNWLWASTVTAFRGHHLLRSDAKTLVYWLTSSGSNVTHTLYYDSVQVAQCSNGSSASGTYDLSGKSPGLYYVESKLTGTDGGGAIRAPFTRYTGSKSYQTPNSIQDDNTSAIGDFTKLANNDLYFRDVMHPNPAFSSAWMALPGSTLSKTIWWGWDRFREEHRRMQYNVWLTKSESAGSGWKLTIKYDSGGANEQTKVLSAAGNNIGYWDLPESTYTLAQYYPVTCLLERENDTYDLGANINYLHMDAVPGESAFVPMDQHVAGQWVYGNTAGQGSKLSLLGDNDETIRKRMFWGDMTTQRQDYTVAVPYYEDSAGAATGRLALPRRFNLLYYRTKDAELQWGSEPETYRLTDYDDAGGNPYFILDLNSVGVEVGQVYWIDGDEMHFAMEIP